MSEAAVDEKKAPAPGMPTKLILMIGGGVLLLVVIGVVLFLTLGKSHDKADKGEQAEEHASETKTAHKDGGKEGGEGGHKGGGKNEPGPIFDLDPFIVNLADTVDSHYLKVTVKLELERPEVAEMLTQRTPQVRDTVLILLSSKEAASIRSAQGKLQLREDLIHRVNSLLPKGGVRGAYFTDFIVQ